MNFDAELKPELLIECATHTEITSRLLRFLGPFIYAKLQALTRGHVFKMTHTSSLLVVFFSIFLSCHFERLRPPNNAVPPVTGDSSKAKQHFTPCDITDCISIQGPLTSAPEESALITRVLLRHIGCTEAGEPGGPGTDEGVNDSRKGRSLERCYVCHESGETAGCERVLNEEGPAPP